MVGIQPPSTCGEEEESCCSRGIYEIHSPRWISQIRIPSWDPDAKKLDESTGQAHAVTPPRLPLYKSLKVPPPPACAGDHLEEEEEEG